MTMQIKGTEKLYLFPKVVYFVPCFDLLEETINVFEKQNFVGSFVSDTFYALKEYPDLVSKFEEKVNVTVSEIGYDLPFKMTTSWFTKTVSGNTIQNKHRHLNSYWSAVYYPFDGNSPLSMVEEKPPIYVPFKTNDPELMMSGEVPLSARKGYLTIFPSYCDHYITENRTKKDRYSLAMNFMPHGVSKWYDSEYNYQ